MPRVFSTGEHQPVSERKLESPIIHIHGQRFPQDPVEIFGTTTGLERLIYALIDAVNLGRGRCEFIVSDGYDAEVRVACLDGQRRSEEWRRSGSPYLDVEDPLVARIMDLTEENSSLRQTINVLRSGRTAGLSADSVGS